MEVNPGEGLDLEDGAFSDLAGEAGSELKKDLKRAAVRKLREKKVLKYVLQAAGWALLVVIAVVVFYGAASYLADLPGRIWTAIASRHVGAREDDYAAYYANEAKYILEGLRDGSVPVGNDMAMLSREDLESVMEYVIEYNDKMLFETSPERVRYFYDEASMNAKTTSHYEKEPDRVETHVIPEEYVKAYRNYRVAGFKDKVIRELLKERGASKEEIDALFEGKTSYEVTIPGGWVKVTDTVYEWGKPKKKYALETLSHQSFGANFQNPYSGDNSFAVPWQVVVALLECYVEGAYDSLGSDEDGWRSAHYESYASDDAYETSMDGYYVTDARIQAICELISYRFEAYKLPYGLDYVQMTRYLVEQKPKLIHYGGGVTRENRATAAPNDYTWGLSFERDEMKLVTYRRIGDYQTGSEEDGTAISFSSVRVPSLAPISISNAYTVVTYEYRDVPLGSGSEEEGASWCSSMTVTTDALRFTEQVRSLIPNFDWGHFIELLSILPGSEREVEKYEKIRALYERGEEMRAKREASPALYSEAEVLSAYRSSITMTGGFYGYQTYVGALSSDRTELGSGLWDASKGIWIGTRLDKDGNPAKAPDGTHDAAYGDWFPLSELSRASFASSDGLTREEVGEVMRYAADNWTEGDLALQALMGSEKAADAAYKFQQECHASVTGVMAVMRVRGDDAAEKYHSRGDLWNLFGLKEEDGELTDYCTYYEAACEMAKLTKEDAFAMSLTAQLKRFWEEYGKKGYASYAALEFGDALSAEIPMIGQEFYLQAEPLMENAYLPWWEDKRFPFLAGCGDGIHMSGIGWCNAAGEFREELLGAVGKTIRGEWAWPVPEYVRVSCEYGWREAHTEGASSFHQGMDIAAAGGSRILAIGSGTVTSTGYDKVRGYYVEITHPGGSVRSVYMHMQSDALVSVGDEVLKGQQIGMVGSTGISTGNHLHVGILENGTYVDPRNYLTEP